MLAVTSQVTASTFMVVVSIVLLQCPPQGSAKEQEGAVKALQVRVVEFAKAAERSKAEYTRAKHRREDDEVCRLSGCLVAVVR